ncbi:unnamed protein product [Zymoseptoria tritici ST99CH_1A5]|uniref:Major facilitator superfamily (MFS) profile domain-containing protein n=1 Tax=Zymoseptoria tritici ST99CH_1A5 TaxID=1276529 RepID=A0A1Y6L6G4_ZYMTR|nr:unnamed protein product [Zymoseptoria tritici ST99CH_1A5]
MAERNSPNANEDSTAWISALFDGIQDDKTSLRLADDLSFSGHNKRRSDNAPQAPANGSIAQPTNVPIVPRDLSNDTGPSPGDQLSIDKEDPINGRTAWLHAITGFLVVFNCWGIGNSWGIFQNFYEILLPDANPSSIAWIGSTQIALVFGLGLPVGRLVDKGYFHSVFRIGTFLMVLGVFSTAWCNQLATLWLTQGLITGTGMGMVLCAGIIAVMTWFDHTTMGSAMALAAAGSCVGGIVYVVLARTLLVSSGFATTMCVFGAVVVGTMIPANLVFRIRGQAKKGDSTRKTATEKVPMSWTIFTDPAYVLAAFGMFFAFMGVYFGFVYIVSYGATVLRLSPTASTNLLIYMLTANLPGRFVPALISDKCIGPLNTMIPSLFLSSAVLFLWAASEQTKASLTVIAVYYGFMSAGVQVLYAAAINSLCITRTSRRFDVEGAQSDIRQDTVDSERLGLRAGGIFTCMGLATLVGTPIGGALISFRTSRNMTSPYLGAQLFAAVSLLLGGIFLLASRVAKIGWDAKRT